ncbi:hypothetical protein H9C73_13400 [Marinobacterium sp. AK62]|uniref:Ribulose bisphosphate carboxylase large subunit C-terminal domain-containing protein n=1 Tax=Marinobacterium alkalitolerans TaxID=1542925 RepID=A0ABS3ZDE3_9GAMM|nr:RuBisCO large subunit C-terminal-like domain-containing protein [Marinobacterium alkalitolerans]MBP0049728.1 hypothetical protein [Marinobacterium alkalitolerans]
MSSGNLTSPQQSELFRWNNALEPEAYAHATYQIVAHCDPLAAATAMAMEQSASTVAIAGYVSPEQVEDWTIRVVSVEQGNQTTTSDISCYGLATEVYPKHTRITPCTVTLAIPKLLLNRSYVQWLNVLVGELPRLGFLSAFRLTHVTGLNDWGPNPAFGIAGIRKTLGIQKGPILCRSMRPAVGLDTTTMVRLNEAVLRGGFHLVKDDELMVFESDSAFEQHVKAMVDCRDRIQNECQERKGYLATLICDPEELERRWEICCEQGVDGVLIAPFIQGIGTLAQMAARKTLPILAHNTGAETLTRHPHWGMAEAVWNTLIRHAGADWLVTSGGFGECSPPTPEEQVTLSAMQSPTSSPDSMPILQGGKCPEGLERYTHCVGNDDYMLIVASWVDGHPQGLETAARIFRESLGRLA